MKITCLFFALTVYSLAQTVPTCITYQSRLTDPNAILSAFIKDGEVKTADIADGAISAAKIAPGAVGGNAVAAGSILSTHIVEGSIGPDRLNPEFAVFQDVRTTSLASILGWQDRSYNKRTVAGTSISTQPATGQFSIIRLRTGTYWVKASQPTFSTGYHLMGLSETTAASSSPSVLSPPGYSVSNMCLNSHPALPASCRFPGLQKTLRFAFMLSLSTRPTSAT